MSTDTTTPTPDLAAMPEPPELPDELWDARLEDDAQPGAIWPERHLTDTGNAGRLVDLHGADLRYSASHAWLTWDGRRWARDTAGRVVEYAKETADAMHALASSYMRRAEAKDIPAAKREAYAVKAEILSKWAFASESRTRIMAMVELAASIPAVRAEAADLDADPFLLNVANGTIDLTTGELRPHRRDDLITKLAPIEYHADAVSETWDQFLAQLTEGDTELEAFLQRAVGYSLTGDTREDALFFVHGRGGSGKSTFVHAVMQVLGDYASVADFESFVAQPGGRGGGAASPDIAKLAGARFVPSIEVDDGKRLAEGIVKTLTGGDKVSARFLYRDTFEFQPAFKLWLVANHAPKVKAEDDGMWRRIKRVPLDRVVAKEDRDPTLRVRLADPDTCGRAVLAWAVRGCLEWQRIGLRVPGTVERATEAYRAEMDVFGDFIESACVLGPAVSATPKALREAYEQHCRDNGETPHGPKAMAAALVARGCHTGATRGRRFWRGIGLRLPDGNGPEVTQAEP